MLHQHLADEPKGPVGEQGDTRSFSATADCRLKTLQHLGRGSSAVVTQCSLSSPKTGSPRTVAMKRINRELLEQPQEVRAFLGEVRLLKQLDHR